MKKFIAMLLAMLMVFSLAACGEKAPAETPAETPVEEAPAEETPAESTEIIIFAAASLQESLTKIAENYMAANPGIVITINFDSSGTLKTQIIEGADCDIFIAASPKPMNALDIQAESEKNPDGNDFVLEGSRVNLLENKVVLAVPEGNPAGIEGYDDLAQKLVSGEVLMAMGNSDVPVGGYTQKILKFYELNEEELAASGVITYGSNVKEVTSQVKEATVDCGVIYATDAFSAGLEAVDTASKDMCGQVVYPAALMKNSANPDAAAALLEYICGPEATAEFEAVGFSPIK